MKTILIVDDSSFMRTLVKKSIAGLDVTIVGEAEDGRVAFEMYAELKPDIVTLDLAMVEYDGIEALKNIINHDPDAKIIVISSTTDQDTVAEEVMNLGAYAVITKPNIKDALVDAINKIENE